MRDTPKSNKLWYLHIMESSADEKGMKIISIYWCGVFNKIYFSKKKI